MSGSAYDPIINSAAQSWGVDPNLLRAVVQQESGGNPGAVSSAGAQGLTQLIPPTAQGLGVTDPSNVTQQIYGGAKYLAQALRAENDNIPAALSYYHGGPDWRKSDGPESQAYAPSVLGIYSKLTVPTATQASNAPSPAESGSDPFSQALNEGGSTPSNGMAPSASAQPSEASDPFSQALSEAQNTVAPPVPGTSTPSAPNTQQPWTPLKSIAQAGIQGAEEGFGSSPLGLSAPVQTALQNAGVYNQPGQYSPVKLLNQAVINPLAAGADLALRSGSALFRGAQGVVSQTGQELGFPALGRDLAAIPEAFMGDTGSFAAPEVAGSRTSVAPEADKGVPAPQNAAEAPAQIPPPSTNPLQAPPRIAPPAAANPLASGVTAPAFVPPGAAAPMLDRITALIRADDQTAATRPAFVPPEAAQPVNALSTPKTAAEAAQAPTHGAPFPAESTATPATPETTAPAAAEAPGAVTSASGLPLTDKAAQAAQITAERQRLLAPANPSGDATQYVPGERLQLADVTGNAADAINAKVLAQTPEGAQPFRDIQTDNNTARANYLDQLAGTPSDIESLDAPRAAQAQQDLVQAFGDKQPTDATPVADTMEGILNAPRNLENTQLQKYISPLLDRLYEDDGSLKSDPEQLYGLREDVARMQSKASQQADPNLSHISGELQAIKSSLDGVIEQGAPGYKNYLSNYATASRPIDTMEYLQSWLPKLTNGASRNLTFGKFDSMMKDIVRKRAAPGVNQAKSIDPATMNALFNLHASLKRAAYTDELAKSKGSDTNVLATFAKKTAGHVAETGAAAVTHGLSVPVIQGGKYLLGKHTLNKQIKSHLYPNVAKLTKGNPLGMQP